MPIQLCMNIENMYSADFQIWLGLVSFINGANYTMTAYFVWFFFLSLSSLFDCDFFPIGLDFNFSFFQNQIQNSKATIKWDENFVVFIVQTFDKKI